MTTGSGFTTDELLYPSRVAKGGPGSGAQPGHEFEGNQYTGGQGGGSNLTPSGHRPLSDIADDIRRDWGSKVNYAAKPYLDAMSQVHDIKDHYYMDSAKSVVSYFLSNASSWRGPQAQAIKSELKALVK